MAEVTRRSFDLKSWQGLTLVLKVARESHLSPTAYAEFRNLVLEYAQQKGTDSKLKAQIDAIIASFDQPQPETVIPKAGNIQEPERLGRRVVPTFAPKAPERRQEKVVPTSPQVTIEPAPIAPPVPTPIPPPPTPTPTPVPAAPAPVAEAPKASQSLKSVEEHRTRIMEIKRRVNSLVKNPITLVDHGDQIGREYMGALLSALKATSPGSTFNLEEAMAILEASYEKVIARIARPLDEEVTSAPAAVPEPVVAAPVPVQATEASESTVEPEPVPEPEQNSVPELPVTRADESLPPKMPEPTVVEQPPSVQEVAPESKETLSPDETRWSEEGGDVGVQEQIRTLREQLKKVEPTTVPVRTERRSLIPSILEIEEEAPPRADITGTDWDPYMKKREDDLSPRALTERPTSTMTGITLDTPQSELMSPHVTMALTKLLHEWKIFASSGLFGMGPGGIEHPLYIRLARLPMGEVISGRFADADMKVVHAIKDYVDAWRHEQGVAYNPSETFEHYLRRVSQRILKRQTGS